MKTFVAFNVSEFVYMYGGLATAILVRYRLALHLYLIIFKTRIFCYQLFYLMIVTVVYRTQGWVGVAEAHPAEDLWFLQAVNVRFPRFFLASLAIHFKTISEQ